MTSVAESAWTFSTGARVGRVWFQWRSLSPIPLFILLLVLPPDGRPSSLVLGFSVFGILLAETVRIWAVGFAGSATRTRGDAVSQLVHAGPFRFVRNPLYLANIALYTLAGVAFGFVGVSIFIFIYSCIQYIFIVSYEEEVLLGSFGQSYQEYCDKVPRWFPLFSPGVESSPHVFSIQKALRSERSTFFSMALMAVLYSLKAYF